MAKPNIQIDNLVREMTDEEYADYLADLEATALREAEELAKIQAKESASAKLAAIGLTAQEIAALTNG
jgi:hypothetical protein